MCLASCFRGIPTNSWPLTMMLPDVGRWMSQMHFRSVVLPTPLGPSTETMEFLSASNEMFFRTSFSP